VVTIVDAPHVVLELKAQSVVYGLGVGVEKGLKGLAIVKVKRMAVAKMHLICILTG
jgi:hypothetical protein